MTRQRGIARCVRNLACLALVLGGGPVSGALAQTGGGPLAETGLKLVLSQTTGDVSATTQRPFSGVLSLREAIERGLQYNLSLVRVEQSIRQAQGQQMVARSVLLPNVTGSLQNAEQRVNLAASGIQFDLPPGAGPGISAPTIVGPFNTTDVRARLSQTIIDLAALNNYRAAREAVGASELGADDSRDAIVLAVGSAYLEAIAARARAQAARAQIETATLLHQRATQQRGAGLATPLDVNRAQVQLLTEQQRLIAFQAEFAKQKVDLTRIIGSPPTDQYELADDVTYSAAPGLSLQDALARAAEGRADFRAAQIQVRSAEQALAAARAERLPSALLTADYGANRAEGTPLRQTYFVGAAVRVPLWEGGRTDGRVQQADAALRQRRAEVEDLRADMEAQVRKAYLDLQAAVSQVDAAEARLRVNRENLTLTRQRFDAGVADNLAVVQSQELVAAGELDRINRLYAHNLAKLALARAIGRSAEDFVAFLNLR